MSLVRALRSAEVSLSHTFHVDEVPTAASGPVVVTAKRLDGTIVQSGNANLQAGNFYTFVKTGYVDLDAHFVEWTGTFGGSSTTVRDLVEIVGDFIFPISTMRAKNPPITDTVKYPLSMLQEARTRAEQECERICNRAFVPRFTRVKLNGSGTSYLTLPDLDPTLIRAASVATRAGATFVSLTGSTLAACAALPGGVVVRDDGGVWPLGYQNVIIEYEYGGFLATPTDLADACLRRARSFLTNASSSIPDRTLSFSTPDGAVYRLTTPTAKKTGIADIDGTYEGYELTGGFA